MRQGAPGALHEDPRWVEFRAATTESSRGTPGAHERYRQAQGPYLALLAEHCEQHVRKPMMRALVETGGMPLGAVLIAFQADQEEREHIENLPPLEPEPVDEMERLQRLPYRVYLRTGHWQKVRKEALDRAGHRCALCNRQDGLQVHHRTYERLGCERGADVIVLCDACHKRHHEARRKAA